MTMLPNTIQVGKCYITRNDQVARVVNLLSSGHVIYAFRSSMAASTCRWTGAEMDLQAFAMLVEREVTPDWTPGERGAEPPLR